MGAGSIAAAQVWSQAGLAPTLCFPKLCQRLQDGISVCHCCMAQLWEFSFPVSFTKPEACDKLRVDSRMVSFSAQKFHLALKTWKGKDNDKTGQLF